MDNPDFYIQENDAQILYEAISQNLENYSNKSDACSDEEWLISLMNQQSEMSLAQCEEDAKSIMDSIKHFDSDLSSLRKTKSSGETKSAWVENKISEATGGASLREYTAQLTEIDHFLAQKNSEISQMITTKSGKMNMNPQLDGVLYEPFSAVSFELSAKLRNRNLKAEVLRSNKKNSVDLRVTDLDALNQNGRHPFENFQLKLGKGSKDTANYIMNGDYRNQRVVVSADQAAEVESILRSEGSKKSVYSSVEAFGIKSKRYTKAEMREYANGAQATGKVRQLNYQDVEIENILYNISHNTGLLGIQSAAISAGIETVKQICQDKEINASEIARNAIVVGADTSLKVAAAGTLNALVKSGKIKCIPTTTPAFLIANLAAIGVENAKIAWQVSSGKVSALKGLDMMGETSTAMTVGLLSSEIGAATF